MIKGVIRELMRGIEITAEPRNLHSRALEDTSETCRGCAGGGGRRFLKLFRKYVRLAHEVKMVLVWSLLF